LELFRRDVGDRRIGTGWHEALDGFPDMIGAMAAGGRVRDILQLLFRGGQQTRSLSVRRLGFCYGGHWYSL
jgi:hypothetical protein